MNNINPRLVTLVCSGTTTTTLFFGFLLSLCPLVFSQLPADQTRTMNELSEYFNKTAIGWNVTYPCQWKGVTCSGSLGITALALSGFDPSDSSFLPVVCKLPSLQSLDVSNNRLSSIPDEFMRSCGRLDGLRLLNFSRNLLIGPLPSFNGFVGLESLDFSFNRLNGDISLLLDELINLKTLNLSRNAFEGSFPTNLGKSKTLEQLELSINRLHGQIPEEIADYGNLKLIDLNGNNLSGSIPYRIGELAKLEFLILSSNNLIGEIPASLSNISTLSRFAANQNNFHGKIPDGITRYVKNLDLSYNRLIGPIPPDLLSPSTLQSVDLSYNSLEGSIPGSISSGLVRLRLGSNFLSGTIPSANYATLLKLTYLELDNNSLSGKIPRELGDCKTLTLLNLAQNKLSGSLPEELGNLHNLQVMKLQLNNLTGEIPSQFGQLPMLSQLNISCNNLSGPIPASISNLLKLANLNLQRNSLSGSIPSSITNMTFLLELQLGDNQLRGEIPSMPPKLQIALNLSSNLFEGTIPETLSRLTGLEVLDLSNNKFYGNIPDALAQMTALTQLILANNQLSGVVPKFNSWVLLNASGNPGLTFPPPSPPNTSLASVKRKKSVVVPIIIALVAAVVAVGGVTVIALTISRRIYRVNDEQLQLQEDPPFPQVIQGNLLTANGIHKSNISFSKAMEAVADPLNIVLKTRFSTYYEAIMPSGMSYLIKKLNWSNKIFQLGSHDKFDQELEVLGKLSNSNIMTPLAYVLSADSAYLFYECAPKGNLFDVLHDNGGNALDWQSRYSIAVGVAQGLAFLHGWTSSPILLLDLSSKSIMLKSLKEPQVGEIELCKVIDPTKSTGSLSTVAGSVGYIPPEYAYTMRVTMAGNVYSFGVILLELLTGKPAVSEGTELAKLVLRNAAQHDKWDRILDISVSRTSLHVRSQMLAVLKVALACVSVSPEARPNMKSVLRMLLNAR